MSKVEGLDVKGHANLSLDLSKDASDVQAVLRSVLAAFQLVYRSHDSVTETGH